MREPIVDIVMGGQWGSESKGLFAAHIGKTKKYDWLISCATRNAGHTVYTEDGTKLVARYLPMAAVYNSAPILISAGTCLHRETLEEEIAKFEAAGVPITSRLFVSSAAGVLTHEHEESERGHRMDVSIGSTCEGVGEALVDRVRRRAPRFIDTVNTTDFQWLDDLEVDGKVLLEGSQGYLLSNQSDYYPYVTSRICSAAAFLAYAKLPPCSVRDVYGVFRTWPIRVANRTAKPYDDGTQDFDPTYSSGPMSGNEVSWQVVRNACGATEEQLPIEITTVTKLPRRIGRWSMSNVDDAIVENGINRPCLSFLNYLDYSCRGVDNWTDLPVGVRDWVLSRESEMGQRFDLLSTSPTVVFPRC